MTRTENMKGSTTTNPPPSRRYFAIQRVLFGLTFWALTEYVVGDLPSLLPSWAAMKGGGTFMDLVAMGMNWFYGFALWAIIGGGLMALVEDVHRRRSTSHPIHE